MDETHFFLKFEILEKHAGPIFQIPAKHGVLKNPRFPDAGAAAGGGTLKSRSRPLPTRPGMKYFRKGNPRC